MATKNKLYQPAAQPSNQLTAAMGIPGITTGTTSRASYSPDGQMNLYGDSMLNHNTTTPGTQAQNFTQVSTQPTGVMPMQQQQSPLLASQRNNSMQHMSNRAWKAWDANGGVMGSPFVPADMQKSNTYNPNMFRDQYRTEMQSQYGPQKMLWGQNWGDWSAQHGYNAANPVEAKNTYLGGSDKVTGGRYYPGGSAKTGGIRQVTPQYDNFGYPING
jgi:hypothetical protein